MPLASRGLSLLWSNQTLVFKNKTPLSFSEQQWLSAWCSRHLCVSKRQKWPHWYMRVVKSKSGSFKSGLVLWMSSFVSSRAGPMSFESLPKTASPRCHAEGSSEGQFREGVGFVTHLGFHKESEECWGCAAAFKAAPCRAREMLYWVPKIKKCLTTAIRKLNTLLMRQSETSSE